MNDGVMSKVRRFLNGTVSELHKCTWPSKSELFESTILVVVSIAVLAVFVFGIDQIAAFLIRFISRAL
ncbi:MAG: preprotein translocase subunit SecE [Victivallales bacterium]|nr:preprotein translocase subunit SecE [Victivallales bacterium]